MCLLKHVTFTRRPLASGKEQFMNRANKAQKSTYSDPKTVGYANTG